MSCWLLLVVRWVLRVACWSTVVGIFALSWFVVCCLSFVDCCCVSLLVEYRVPRVVDC